jgi:ATP-dependent protease HslVU (ClpYQ) peptidase subunit
MTCIVGIEHQGKVYIGGDRAGTENGMIVRVAQPKVFASDGYLMGYTTSFRMGQILQHCFIPPPVDKSDDLIGFMVRKFVPALQRALAAGEWLKTKDGRQEAGTFLVGVQGRLFVVEDDFNVHSSRHGFYAVGSGAAVALGALWQSMPENARTSDNPKDRLRMALEAAQELTTAVAGPFDILESGA